jgi:RHS repeat-associated protein
MGEMDQPGTATLPLGAQSFDFEGQTYQAGDTLETTDACRLLNFAVAFQAANPGNGVSNSTPGALQNFQNACVAGPAATPGDTASDAGTAGDPALHGGDSGANQGAPAPVNPPLEAGNLPPDPAGVSPSQTEEPARPPVGQPDPNGSGERPREQTTGGDPVELFNGAVYLDETDLEIPETPIPLAIRRVYRSGAGFHGPLGWNWDHNHNVYVRELANGDIALWRLGHEERFVWTGAAFEPPRGVFERLERVTGIAQAFELVGAEGVTQRFERPGGWVDGERVPLLWTADRHGNQIGYTYGAADHLLRVQNDDGRFVAFDYDDCGLVIAVFDHAGRRYEYEHDEESQHLVRVVRPATTDHPAGTQCRYYYELGSQPPSLRHNLLRAEDAEGNVYLENDYEVDPSSWQYGRVLGQLYGGYLFQFRYSELQWVSPAPENVNVHAVRVEILNPEFGLETYTFNFRGDLLDQRYRLNSDASYRVVAWQYEYDGQGNRTVTTKPDGSQEILTYAFEDPDPRMRGRLLRKELTAGAGFPAPSRIVWKGTYEPRYQLLTRETDEANATTRMRYDFDLTPAAASNTGKLKEIVQPDATLPDGSVQTAKTTFEQNGRGQIVAIVLPDGSRDEYRYGTAGEDAGRLVEEIHDIAGAALTRHRARDAFGFVAEKIDGNGGVTRRVHNALGQLEIIEHPVVDGSRAEQRYHYDAHGHVVSIERPIGSYSGPLTGPGTTHFVDLIERDVLGYAIRIVLASNSGERREVRFDNDYRGTAVKTWLPDGTIVRTTFDERHLPLAEEVEGADGLRIDSGKRYDLTGRLIRETDVHGSVSTFEYDGFSRLQGMTLPNGSRRRFTWLRGDLLETEEVIGDDGLGGTRRLALIRHAYDAKGRRVSTTESTFVDDPTAATGVTTRVYYDRRDRVAKTVDHRGGETVRTYDGAGRLLSQRDPVGNEERNTYDGNGNVVARKSLHREPGGGVATLAKAYEYDARDRCTAMIEPDGARTAIAFDDRDLAVEHTDTSGVVTRTSYDAYHVKVRDIQDAGGLDITQQWVVDEMSRTTAYVDPTGEITHYAFDSVGRLTHLEQPNGFATTRTFNDNSQVVTETMASGIEFTYAFDAANRVTMIVNSATPAGIQSVPTHAFTYDGQDRLTRASAGAEAVLRAYDSRGRLVAETTQGSTITCHYDDITGEVEKVWPDGRTEVLAHDLNGILTTIKEVTGGELGGGTGTLATFRVSGPSALGDASYRGGTVLANAYDERKRLVTMEASGPGGLDQQVRYRYDTRGSRRVEALSGQTTQTSYYEFDARRRLLLAREGFPTPIPDAVVQAEHDFVVAAVRTASVGAPRQEAMTYDAADARSTLAVTGAPLRTYTYASGHRIQSDGSTAYAFHTDGALASAGADSYDVDALGRITAVRSGATTSLALQYDALGRPSVIKEAGQADRTLHYLGGFVEQESENGTPVRQMTLHPVTGVPIAFHSAAGTHFALVDARFNLLALVDGTGASVETYRYRPFGTPEIFDAAGASLARSAFGVEPIFGGQRYVAEAGLYLSKKRLMDPRLGLFLAPDPKGYADSPMLHAYAAQNPIDNVDPNGEIIPLIIAAFVIGGALLGAGYSIYDAYNHPERYEGVSGTLRVLGNVFGGAVVGGAGIIAGEAVLAMGGAGVFASGSATALTATQSFVLYGTSAATSGAVLHHGFNSMFPEYVDPVTPGSVAFDFVTGGGLGAAVRLLSPVVGSGVSSLAPRSWANFAGDLGGEAPITGQLGPYPGKIGAWLDSIGIRQGYSSAINNFDAAGPWYARVDTGIHEGFHVFVARYFPTFRNLSHGPGVWTAAARYPEEVMAYAVGHGAAGRLHGVPFAPLEAFNSLGGYTSGQQTFAKWFWGTAWAIGFSSLGVGLAHAQTPPNEKPPAAK